MECYLKFRKLCHFDGRRKVMIVGIVAITYIMVQCFMLPYGNAFKSLGSDHEVLLSVKHGYSSGQLSVRLEKKDENNLSNVVVKRDDQVNTNKRFVESGNASNGVDENIRGVVWEGTDQDEPGRNEKLEGLEIGYDIQENQSKVESDDVGKIEEVVGVMHQISLGSNSELNVSSSFIGNANVEHWNKENLKQIDFGENRNQVQVQLEDVRKLPGSDHAVLLNDSRVMGSHRRKKVRPGMPPIRVIPIDRMNRILAKHLSSSSKMKPQWSSLSDRDKEINDAKLKIISSDVSQLNNQLYAPVFRNVSMFLRSYELMEKILKVYIYRDGQKPIFHQPILKGLYASEGWFMKLMEGNKHFVVKNPERAHLFYMPFSSRMLEYALYVPNSHNRTKLRQFVKGYTEAIAAKYPFWNRTGGRDHFVVACHDWAPYETRHHMENSIKALCNADATIGFKIGRDVSLPETFVRNERYPLRDLGGKPPSDRNILAFYAGSSHGYLRPILLNHWKDKDPEMRIYGMLPTSVSRRMSYMQHMKSSKYCICPKGHEVNSPRVIEAIFYECVPVIISDNFVPPFFEILNWEAFAIILAEKDIPNLKDILVSIPEEKYIEMQLAVRKVQQHFLWHARPKKYDLFHMTLHSIWYSRVFQIRRQ